MQDIILSQISLKDLKTEIAEAVRETMIPIINHAIIQPPDDELLNRRQTAVLLGVSCPTLLDWTKKGKIKGYRIGTRVRYKKAEIMAAVLEIKTGR